MEAFQYAVDLGYAYLETDVHVTADGVVVAFHDADLQRSCAVEGTISSMRWSELCDLRVDGVGRIPRLVDLLEAFPTARLNIDAKSDEVVPPLVAILRAHDVLDRVCLGSFSDRRLTDLRRQLGPRLCTSFGPAQVAALRTLRRSIGAGHAAQVPVAHRGIPVVTRSFIEAAHRRNVAVHVWTVDDPAEMNRLLDIGVDGIMTDRPTVLRDMMMARQQWIS